MIIRGIVEKLVDRYTVKVRIPLLHNASNASTHILTGDLDNAKICTLPQCDPNIQVGDVVIVGFENNDYSKPIVLGYLYGANSTKTPIAQELHSLLVSGAAKLSSNTTIGNISKEEIAALKGVKYNIQDQLDRIYKHLNIEDKE